ncbi:MAG: hypothetical protein Q9167_002070 [Letrouitia subvulpina]
MPPPLAQESDAESVADELGGKLLTEENKKLHDAVVTENGNEDEAIEGDDGDSEVYVVEAILNHHDNFEDGVLRYEVKWKGYEKKADRTWETEENLEGARDILEEYWNSIGGKPVPGSTKQTKKRNRQSTGKTTAEPAKRARKGRKSAAADSDATSEPPVGYSDVNPDTWKPPAPLDGAWDKKVQAVDTIEKDDKGELWAYLVWNDQNDDGRFNRSKARLATCNKACPQKMLQFYEKHV